MHTAGQTGGEIEAIVAGGVDFSEADRVVYLLTRQGAISAFAHGAKKSKRRFAGALEPFATVDATLVAGRRSKKGLPTLEQAVAKRVRLELRTDLDRIALASYVVELSHRTAPEGEACDAQYELTVQTLDHIAEHGASVAARRAFELRLLAELGYAPHLESCVQCGDDPGRLYLELMQGGLHCSVHRGRASEIGPKTRQWMQLVLTTPEFEPAAGLPTEWAETAAARLARCFARVWPELLDRPLKSAALVDALR